MSEIPYSWVMSTLGEVCYKPQYGWTTKSSIRGRVKYLRTTDLSSGKVNWETVPFCIDEPTDIEKFLLKDNDIVVSRAGSIGLSYRIINPPKISVFASYLIRLRSKLIEPEYLGYFLKSADYWKQISDVASGIAVQNINASKLSDLEVPIAPVEEQKRIVKKLNDLFIHLNQLNTHVEKMPQIINQLRQTILAKAVSGALTKEWREDNELEQWSSVTLSDVVKEKPRNGFSPQGVDFVTPVKSLTLSATTSGSFDPRYVKYLDIKVPPKDSHLWLKKGDILIQRSNSLEYVGTSVIYDRDDNEFIYPDLMMKIKVNEKIINRYLHYCLSEQSTREYFRQNATGTAGNMPKINQGTVLNTPILLPSMAEQNEIVKRVESLFNRLNLINSKYDLLRKDLERLPMLGLRKAFTGKLIDQDPDDVPAEKLLGEI